MKVNHWVEALKRFGSIGLQKTLNVAAQSFVILSPRFDCFLVRGNFLTKVAQSRIRALSVSSGVTPLIRHQRQEHADSDQNDLDQ
jgi:hypothetical protein